MTDTETCPSCGVQGDCYTDDRGDFVCPVCGYLESADGAVVREGDGSDHSAGGRSVILASDIIDSGLKWASDEQIADEHRKRTQIPTHVLL